MPAQILLAPVGAGKTAYVLERLSQTLAADPFPRVWVLVSGKRQEDAFRQRLVEQHGRQVYFNVEFFTVYQLYRRLLNIAQQPPRMLDEAARFGLLRAIINQLNAQGRLQVYAGIADTPGFVRIMAAFIYELKQNLVRPEDFTDHAHTPKDQDIAHIYAAYQENLLSHNLVDREGEGWLALHVLEQPAFDNIGRNVDLLIVDGYDQFTPLQASLLMLVAQRAQSALITLATVPGRSATVGQRFEEALAQLQRYSPEPLQIIDQPPELIAGQRPAALQHLIDNVFRRDAIPQPAYDQITLIEAPDISQEAAAVLRRVKQLLLTTDARPDDIVIALRDWPRYAGDLTALGQAYELPLTFHEGEALDHNPAVMSLLNLLRLPEHDFRRRELLDALRSPYFAVPGIGQEQVDQLAVISQKFLVTGGRRQWLAAIQRARQPGIPDDEADVPAEPLLTSVEAQTLHEHLAAFFAGVLPPQTGSVLTYVHWLRALIGPDINLDPDDEATTIKTTYTLNMPQQIEQGDAPGITNRDRTALAEFVQVLRSLLRAETLLDSLAARRHLAAGLFLAELQTAVDNTSTSRNPGRTGQVLVTTVTDARGLPHQHVFILGLAEGIFPMPQREDPLYLDSERVALNARGITLETHAERAADDGLFYQLIGLARATLTLSRPTIQDGTPWIASHLWRAVTASLSDAPAIIAKNEIKVGEIVAAHQAAAVDELVLAVAAGLTATSAGPEVAGAYNWLWQTHADHWQRIQRARMVELGRMARRQAHDRYSGRLSDPNLIAYVAGELSSERLWSASQLNDYGMCGFRFFAKRLLKLEALEELEEGLDAAKLGTINHEILEKTYAQLGEQGYALSPENLDVARRVLHEVAAAVLEAAPEQQGFPDDALWEQEKGFLMRRLEALVALDFSADNPVNRKIADGIRYPFQQEAGFSMVDSVQVSIPIVIDDQTEPLRVMGYIDRMDRIDDQIVIVDYKTGTTKIPVSAMLEGRNFQMMVYLRAAAQILAAQPVSTLQLAGGLFWHIRDQKSSGEIRLDEDGEAALNEAAGHIGRYIAAGRRGDFTVQPRKLDRGRCAHYCEFSQLCRVASTSRYKPDAGL